MEHNNFDFLRLIFSIFVIIGHSYSLCGSADHEIVHTLTSGQLLLQDIALPGFFLTSGFFIFPSLIRSNSLFEYFIKRLLRIYPALILMTIVTCLFSVFMFSGTAAYYFTHWSLYKYALRAPFLYLPNTTIYDVFANSPSKSLNGSLWTIPYEFTWYIAIMIFYLIRKNKNWQKVLMSVFSVFIVLYNVKYYTDRPNYYYLISGEYLLYFGSFFMVGAWASLFKDEINKYKLVVLSIGFLLFFITIYFKVYSSFNYLIIPMVLLPIGLYQTPFIKDIGKNIGDLSYGIYIYGWYVQQTLYHFFKPSPIQLMTYAVIIASVLGYLSWHLIEKRALDLKSKIKYLSQFLGI